MARFVRDGVSLYYEDHGVGPAIVLSHGFGATSQMWRGQVDALRDRYRILTWDMRGHGQSDYPDDQALYSMAHTIADMAALLDHCQVKVAVIGGLSLGGYATLAFNLAYPDRCRALMLFDTGPGFKKDEAREAWNTRARERALKFEQEGLAARSDSAEAQLAQHRDATGLARAARGMLTQQDARVINTLPEIAVPVLVLVGEEDVPFVPAADYMAAKIPHSQKIVIPIAGHAANLHNPSAFNRAMADFLDALPS
jgi:pimeloyl-ACP methyl ester carboxylesterase